MIKAIQTIQTALSLMEIDNLVIGILAALVVVSVVRRWWFRWGRSPEIEECARGAGNKPRPVTIQKINGYRHAIGDAPVLVVDMFPRRPWHTCSWLVQGLVAAGNDVILVKSIDILEKGALDDKPKVIVVLARNFPATLHQQLGHAKMVAGAPLYLIQAHLYSLGRTRSCTGSIRDLSGIEVKFTGRHPELLVLGELLKRVSFTV